MPHPRPSASAAVVAYVESLILDGRVAPGESLPSESELSEKLDVSRLTVREGMRMLEARCLIDVAHGRRPTVAFPSSRPLQDFFVVAARRDSRGMLDLIEVRVAIEVHAAELAAANATRSDLETLQRAIDDMRATADEPDQAEAFNEADLRFHAAVASASGIRMLDFLVESMESPLQRSRASSTAAHRKLSDGLGDLVAIHAQIFDAIKRRDPASAASLMRTHLDRTRADLYAAFEASD